MGTIGLSPTFAALILGGSMAGKRKYDIAFVGLKPGKHEYTFELDNEFFAGYEAKDFNDANALVKLVLDKKPGFMMLLFDVGGTVFANCDRCGNDLKIDLWDEFKMVVKLVDQAEEMNNQENDPDIYYIERTESHLHLADWLYEFVTLSIPAVKVCSANEDGSDGCNPEVLAKLKALSDQTHETQNDLWKGLKNLKGLNDKN